MAGNSIKKQAISNTESLNTLYKFVIPILCLGYVRFWFSSGLRGLVVNSLLNSPLVFCLYVFEKNSRPVYETVVSGAGSKQKLVHGGSIDLANDGGLTEYMFDLIYLSLIGNVGKIVFGTNKVWWLVYILIPVYVLYKVNGLKNQYFGSGAKQEAKVDERNGNTETKSKRQAKREKRGDKPQVRYR